MTIKTTNELILRIDEINNLITGKLALKYGGREIDAIRAIASASQKRSLADFQKVDYFTHFNP